LHLCSVAAERSGFRSVTYAGILTEAGRTRVVNFRLKRPDERDIAIVVSRDPFPYEDFVRGFTGHVAAPVRVVDLDREPDPADAGALLARDLRDAAERRGLWVEVGLCRSDRDIRPALDVMRGRIDGLVVPNDDLTSIPRAQDIITAWALENHVPLAVSSPEW